MNVPIMERNVWEKTGNGSRGKPYSSRHMAINTSKFPEAEVRHLGCLEYLGELGCRGFVGFILKSINPYLK